MKKLQVTYHFGKNFENESSFTLQADDHVADVLTAELPEDATQAERLEDERLFSQIANIARGYAITLTGDLWTNVYISDIREAA